MSEYPLYPHLTEEGEKEATEIIESFKEKMKKAANEALSDLYCNCLPYIESDAWTNFRNELLAGFSNYGNRKIQAEYDFAKIRKAIFIEFREEIMKEMPAELVAENERLEGEIKWLTDRRV